MGNCVFKGFGEVEEMIKVVTSNGGIMELYAPITAECITNEFPGHAIFRTHDLFSQPLLHNEELHAGQLYYLLPLNNKLTRQNNNHNNLNTNNNHNNLNTNNNHNNLNTNNNKSSSSIVTPYRMSFDNQKVLKRTDAEVLPRYNSSGVWKVKLVISPEQLAEILAQEARTEALIESVRTVAKCGNGVGVSSVASSDQWSVSSSWKGSADKYGADT